MKVIMSGGGTGGHIYPAIAIADTIKANLPDANIIFTGNGDGLEGSLVTEAGYDLYNIECRGFNRSLSLKNIKAAFLAMLSPGKGRKLIKQFKPDVVIGTGGYACWPIMKAAVDMGVHSVIHESNSIPGLTVKMLSSKVEKILVNYDMTIELVGFPKKTIRVGNPLRADFGIVSPELAKKKIGHGRIYEKYILSYGGSGGAERINECALELMKKYVSKHREIFYVHITGNKNFDAVRAEFRKAGFDKCDNILLLPYTHEMSYYMSAADIVIARCGALTLSELALMSKAAILIPSPNVTNNHQYHNAKVLYDKTAALMIEEKELDGDKLCQMVAELITNEALRKKLSFNIKQFAVPDSNKIIFREIMQLTENSDK